MKQKVRIPDHLADSSKEIEISMNDTIEQAQFVQAFNCCHRILSGVDVTWKERVLMLSHLVRVNGKTLDLGEWEALLHGDFMMLNQFCRLCAKWVLDLIESPDGKNDNDGTSTSQI